MLDAAQEATTCVDPILLGHIDVSFGRQGRHPNGMTAFRGLGGSIETRAYQIRSRR